MPNSWPSPVPPVLLLDDCWWDCQRALMDELVVFLCGYYSTIILHAHISPGGLTLRSLVAAVQRRSLTPSMWSSALSNEHVEVAAMTSWPYTSRLLGVEPPESHSVCCESTQCRASSIGGWHCMPRDHTTNIWPRSFGLATKFVSV